jgi:hypothetical protein
VQVEQRQDLGHLREAARVRWHDRASEPRALAGRGVHPAIVDPGCGHLDGTGAGDHGPGTGVAVANHQGSAAIVPGVPVPL